MSRKAMEQKCLLTVAIPTFNGSRSLELALRSALSQAGPGVEVLVSDNCSTDNTGEVVKGLQADYPALKYSLNEANVGYDRNVDLAVRRASGAFVWLLGDDDVILPGGIGAVLAAIKAAPDSGVIYADCPHPLKLKPGAGGHCLNGDDFFELTHFKSGFISTNVFNRTIWQRVDLSRYFDTGWVHVGFLIEALPLAPSYIVRSYCADYIRDLPGGMRWGGDGSFIYTGLRLARLYQRMDQLPYRRETRRRAYWSVKGAYWRNICLAKAKGFRVDLPVVRECMSLYKGFASFWLLDLPILLIPGVFFRTLFRFWKSRVGNNMAQAIRGRA